LVVHKKLVGALPSNVKTVDLARVTDLANIIFRATFDRGRGASGKSGGERDEGE
jgi:hypothetical protein